MMMPEQFKGTYKDNRGFSVSEVLVATAIMSLMTAIAVPSFLSMQPGLRLNGASRAVFGKLMWARAQGVEENITYSVVFPNNHTMQIIRDVNANSVADTGESTETVDIQTDYPDCTFAISGVDTTPNFHGRGTTDGQTVITVSNSAGARVITVLATGSIKIN
jgi:prepilin-type N-terminal cleavage/methylation domain-containing protein